jgi:hypothetical protein
MDLFPFAYPLGICEGDCDNDSECGDDLVYFKRDRFDPIPGYFGDGVFGKINKNADEVL